MGTASTGECSIISGKMYRKSFSTSSSTGGVGGSVGGGITVSKMLKFYFKVFMWWATGAVKVAILYADRTYILMLKQENFPQNSCYRQSFWLEE